MSRRIRREQSTLFSYKPICANYYFFQKSSKTVIGGRRLCSVFRYQFSIVLATCSGSFSLPDSRRYCHRSRRVPLHLAVKGDHLQDRPLALIKVFWQPNAASNCLPLTFVETIQRINVRTAVTIFSEESGNSFCRMIGAHHDTAGHTRNAILCFIRSRAFHCHGQNRSVQCLLPAMPALASTAP